MKKALTLVLFVLTFSITSYAQDQKHPIDKEMDACIDKDPSTRGMIECMDAAKVKWDVELNKYYKLLMSTLNDSSKASLRESQRKWIEFRDAEIDAIGDIYEYKYEVMNGGTLYSLMAVGRSLEVVKTRALELISYYEVFHEFDDK